MAIISQAGSLSSLSRAGTYLWGLHQSGHHQPAAVSLSNRDPPAISPKGGSAVRCPVPKGQEEGALTWPQHALPEGGSGC